MAGFVAGEVARTGAGRVAGLGYSNGANILASVTVNAGTFDNSNSFAQITGTTISVDGGWTAT